jgi:membrane-bound lytic murein transglycosylase D
MKDKGYIFIVLFCWTISACDISQVQNKITRSQKPALYKNQPSSINAKSTDQNNLVDTLDFDYNVNYNDLWDEIRDHIQLSDEIDHPEVQQQIAWFQSHQKYFQRLITKSAPFIHYIYQQTKDHDMPSELALLPIIESAYNPLAYSKAGAMGLWQMMPGTAALLGVKMNSWYDGRRDLNASTAAALNYLTYSYEHFNHDWLLAIASYNCGESRIQASINHNKKLAMPSDFWSLRLPQETKNYIPKFLAIAAIVKDPARYNITLPPINNAPYIESIKINSQIDLHQAAKLANIDIKTIHELNPGYLRFATDPDGPHELILPIDKTDIFKQNFESLPENEKITWRDYHTEYGDSLDAIANKYNTEPIILKRVNNLANNTIKPKQHLLVPVNYRGGVKAEYTSPQSKEIIAYTHKAKRHLYIYKVVANDTVYSLAKKFNSSVKAIIKTNHLKTIHLKPEQIIKIPEIQPQNLTGAKDLR